MLLLWADASSAVVVARPRGDFMAGEAAPAALTGGRFTTM